MDNPSGSGCAVICTKVADIVDWMEECAPARLAESWDYIGLQCGDPQASVRHVKTALTVTEQIVEEAAAEGATLIVAHHPVIFGPLTAIRPYTRIGGIVARLVKEDIALLVAHTNLDSSIGGVNDGLAQRLKLKTLSPLLPQDGGKRFKLVTFVPYDSESVVRNALATSGAGVIGNYSHCTFALRGEGTFKPLPGATPHIGEVDRVERVAEVRLEVLVADDDKEKAIQALKAAHPYEEAPIDLYPLVQQGEAGPGLGRVGSLPVALSTEEFVNYVKNALNLKDFRLAGAAPSRIEKVAVVGGSGGSFVGRAGEIGADALITGDVDYHDADEARCLGLLVVDGGHFGTEKHVPEDLARYLENQADLHGASLKVSVATETDSFWSFQKS